MLLSVFVSLFDRIILHACVFISFEPNPYGILHKTLLWLHVGALAFHNRQRILILRHNKHELEILSRRLVVVAFFQHFHFSTCHFWCYYRQRNYSNLP